MTRPLRTVLAILAAVFTLGLGLVGTATVGTAATAVTKAQVKKIAKKVVKRSASRLTVRNAVNLAGKPASAYLDTATTFVLPTQPEQTSRHYSFDGLAPGTYQVSYNVMIGIGAGFASNCALYASGSTGPQEGWTYGAQYTGFNAHAATTLLTVTSGPAPQFFCSGSDPSQIYAGNQVSRVTFVPIDSVTTGTPPLGVAGRAGEGAAG
jgi:hypothetical protein